MQQIRAAALSRHSAPDFVMVGGLELMQLRKLPWLARALFLELLAIADHATGRVATSYAVLTALLDFDQSPGAHALDKPSTKRLRTALEQLEGLRLVAIDRKRNEAQKGLFLSLTPRPGISAPNARKGRGSGRPENGAKRATARPAASQAPEEGQTDGQGVQDGDSSPISPLSTEARLDLAAAVREHAAAPPREGPHRTGPVQLGELLRAAGGKKVAPQGGQNVARPAARTPPAGDSPTVRAMKARLKKK